MLTVRNSGAVFGSMVGWKMVMRLATALNFVRSARFALHANHSDVTTAPTVPAAATAAMVCWYALKNSSIMLDLPSGCLSADPPGKLQHQEPQQQFPEPAPPRGVAEHHFGTQKAKNDRSAALMPTAGCCIASPNCCRALLHASNELNSATAMVGT